MIYVASSWRNPTQPRVVRSLTDAGFDVYDFREPVPGDRGFHWSDIDPTWKGWDPAEFVKGLEHPIAAKGFKHDFDAMNASDACLLVMPCGRSAHIEAGFFVGHPDKKLVIMLGEEPAEPELMYLMADRIVLSVSDAVSALREVLS